MSLLSTRWFESWQPDVCYRRNISALVALEGIHSDIMDWQARFIHISRALSEDMLVRHVFFPCLHLLNVVIDVLAHRQLSAAIGYTPLHATLHSKNHVERVLDVVNRRHRMAQMAGRASVEFYVGLALKARGEALKGQVREEAFVIRTFRNGLGVFVSK